MARPATRFRAAKWSGPTAPNDGPRPGRGKLVKRPAFPAVNKALSVWKELTAPRAVTRSAEHMPIGV